MSSNSRIIAHSYRDYEEYTDTRTGQRMHKGICIHCGQVSRERTGTTSNFVRHVRRKHPAKHKEYLNQKTSPAADQPTISSFSVSDPAPPSLKLFDPKQPRPQAITDSILRDLVIGCGLPFSIVDNPCFRRFVNLLEPRYSFVSRATITSTLLPKLAEEFKTVIKERLQDVDGLSLTVDIWSDRRMRSFLGVTAHIVEDQKGHLNIQSYTLGCHRFQGSHTGLNIASAFEELLEEFAIKNKVNYILTDNAANMKAAFKAHFPEIPDEDEELDDEAVWSDLDDAEKEEVESTLFHRCRQRLSCFAHTLQLTVGDGLKETGRQLSLVLGKASKLTSILHTSTVMKERFSKAFGEKCSIPASNTTRWNSTYRQFQAILSLDHNKLTDVCGHEWAHLAFTTREWNQLGELVDVLGPFLEATDLTQGEQSVTISLVVPTVLSLYHELRRMAERGRNPSCQAMIKALQDSLLRRFRGIFSNVRMVKRIPGADPFGEQIYIIAAMLDPAFSLHWVDTFVSLKDQDASALQNLREDLKDSFKDILNTELAATADKGLCPATTVPDDDDNSDASPPRKVSRLFSSLKRSRNKSGDSGSTAWQIKRYLELCEEEHDDEEPLLFWARWRHTLPTMFTLVKKVFSVVATSAPVERVFSRGGIFMRPHRSSLDSKTLSALVFVKCNEKQLMM